VYLRVASVSGHAPVATVYSDFHVGLGAILDFLGFFYRAFLKKIKYFFKTSQPSKNYCEVWAPVLENSRSYSVLKFIFFWGILGVSVHFGGFPGKFRPELTQAPWVSLGGFNKTLQAVLSRKPKPRMRAP
jgi:hypothetical protein